MAYIAYVVASFPIAAGRAMRRGLAPAHDPPAGRIVRGAAMTVSYMMRCVLVAGVLALAAKASAQSSYPSKPITLILPYAPGGSTSTLAYLIRQKLTDSWSQQIVVQHRPGGSATIGAATAAKAPADGYTLILVTATHIISPLLLPYRTLRSRISHR
jgi:hypothetical protein